MSDTSKMPTRELADWCVAEFEALDPEVHAGYRVDASIAVRLARAYLDLLRGISEQLCGDPGKIHSGHLHYLRGALDAIPEIEKERDSLREQLADVSERLEISEKVRAGLATNLDTARAEVERLTADEHSAVERGNRLAREVERLRGAIS
jgi:hypothetical protein